MTEKKNFTKAFNCLSKNDAPVVKDVITSRCNWGGPNLFYKKMSGERAIQKCSQKGIDELLVIESVFKCFGLNAWTGVRLSSQPLDNESPPT